MIVYTTFVSDDGNIELTVFLHRESSGDPFICADISIKFRDEYGQELEYWDNQYWIDQFMDRLENSRWALIAEMINRYPDKKVDMDYIFCRCADILKLWNAAKELKIV